MISKAFEKDSIKIDCLLRKSARDLAKSHESMSD